MTLSAFILVFLSVFLHATWNMLSKSVKPSMAFYAIMGITAALLWSPFFFLSTVSFHKLGTPFLLLLAGSVFGEIIYMLGLARAYRFADISFVYPLVRALPVLLVAGVTLIFGLGKTPSATAVAGMLVITFGCLIMPLVRFRDFSPAKYLNGTVFYILLGAAGTTMYTIFDNSAIAIVRDSAGGKINIIDTLGYLFLIESGLTIGELLFVALDRRERALFKKLFCRSVYPVLAGIAGSAAYALILLAMAYVTNVAYIQAFRQMSLPIGFFAGVVLLKEKAPVPKIAGLLLIVAGLVTVALGA